MWINLQVAAELCRREALPDWGSPVSRDGAGIFRFRQRSTCDRRGLSGMDPQPHPHTPFLPLTPFYPLSLGPASYPLSCPLPPLPPASCPAPNTPLTPAPCPSLPPSTPCPAPPFTPLYTLPPGSALRDQSICAEEWGNGVFPASWTQHVDPDKP